MALMKLISFSITFCLFPGGIHGDESYGLTINRLANARQTTENLLKRFTELANEGEGTVESINGDVILVLGLVGSGKTTLTQFLADDNSNLKSVRSRSGEFVIQDADGRISSTRTAPKTIFPELYFDVDTNQAYYDCPGLDLADSVVQITSAYFMQEILHYADNIKIIFTIDYASIKNDTEYEDSLSLLEYSTMFLRVMDKYKNSVGLVVTKVDGGSEEDDQIISKVAEYIESLKESLQETYENVVTNEYDKRAMEMLDAFTTKVDDSYAKIGIFRRPDEIGPLNTIDSLQERKHMLYKLVDSLNFTLKDEHDFGQTLSEKAHLDIERLHRTINQKTLRNLRNVFDEIQRYHDISLEKSPQIFTLLQTHVIPSLNDLKKCINFENFHLGNIINCVSHFQPNVHVLCNDFVSAAENIDYLRILKIVGGKRLEDSLDENVDVNFLSQTQLLLTENTIDFVIWKDVLFSTYNELEEYKIQANRSQAISSNATAIWRNIDDENYHNILAGLQNHSEALSLSKPPSKSKLNTIETLLKSTLEFQIAYTCVSPTKLRIEGNYIVLSQMDIKNRCSGTIIDIQIFGLYKVFIDGIPDEMKATNIAILSPRVEQVDFDIMRSYGGPSEPKLWLLSYMYLFGKYDYFLYTAACDGLFSTACYQSEFAPAINNFKMYVLENGTVELYQESEYFKSLNKRHWGWINIYNTMGYIDELKKLESEFYKLNNKRDFLPSYQSLLERIADYAKQPNSDEDTPGHKKALRYVYTATLGKICNIKDNIDDDLIIDITEYLKVVIGNVQEFQEKSKASAKRKLIESYRNTFDKQIKQKIDEATYFIDTYITRDINELLEEANAQIPKLFGEIIHIQQQLQSDIAYTKDKYYEMKDIMARKAALGVVSLLGKICGFFGIFGALISLAIDVGVGVANAIAPDTVEINRQFTQLPEGVQALLQKTTASFREIEDERVKQLRNDLDVTLHFLKDRQNQYQEYYLKFQHIQFETRRIKFGQGTLDTIDQLRKEFDAEYRRLEEEERSSRHRRHNNDAVMMHKIRQGREVAQVSIDLFNQCKYDGQKLEAISQIITDLQQSSAHLSRYKDKIFEIITPTLNGMRSYVNDLERDASVQSEIGLLMSKWEMQRVLRDIKFELQEVTRQFAVQGDLGNCIDKIYESLATMMTLYERIRQYEDDKTLGDFVSDIALASNDASSQENSELGKAVSELDEIVHSNIILNQYGRAVNAFKQHIFPFADFFMHQYSLPDSLEVNKTENVIGHISSLLEDLQEKVTVSEITIDNRIDRYLHETTFSGDLSSSKPFYVWKNNQYKNMISKLLSGKEIVLKADVMKSLHDKNAIKFKSVEINLKAIKESIQNEMDTVLKKFVVSLTHMGNSYYRCDDKYYVIRSDSQEIRYSFERDHQDEPILKNMVYKKIKKGDLMLSPFTTWKIKVENQTDDAFDLLERFKNRVDLELVGQGYYVSRNSAVCGLNLETYYKLANPVYDMVDILSKTDKNV